jgi:hypothetical protein
MKCKNKMQPDEYFILLLLFKTYKLVQTYVLKYDAYIVKLIHIRIYNKNSLVISSSKVVEDDQASSIILVGEDWFR